MYGIRCFLCSQIANSIRCCNILQSVRTSPVAACRNAWGGKNSLRSNIMPPVSKHCSAARCASQRCPLDKLLMLAAKSQTSLDFARLHVTFRPLRGITFCNELARRIVILNTAPRLCCRAARFNLWPFTLSCCRRGGVCPPDKVCKVYPKAKRGERGQNGDSLFSCICLPITLFVYFCILLFTQFLTVNHVGLWK